MEEYIVITAEFSHGFFTESFWLPKEKKEYNKYLNLIKTTEQEDIDRQSEWTKNQKGKKMRKEIEEPFFPNLHIVEEHFPKNQVREKYPGIYVPIPYDIKNESKLLENI